MTVVIAKLSCVVVAYCVEGRSREQCAKRWEQLFPTNIIRGRWQEHEDAVSCVNSRLCGPFQVDVDKPVVLKEGAFGDPLALKACGPDHVLVGRLVSDVM